MAIKDDLKAKGRMPGFASAIDVAKNVGATMNFGYNAASFLTGNGFTSGFNVGRYGGSVGGALTLGGLAVPGAIAGAALGTMMDGANIGATAAIGAGIGFAAPVALGAAGYGIEKLGSGIGKFFTSTALDGSGATIANTAKGFGSMAAGIGSLAVGAINSKAATQQLGLMNRLSQHVVNFKETAEGIENVKLGGVGWAMLAGGAAIEAGKKAFNTYNQIHMGQMDGQIRRAAPSIPAYADNAGASGDLVFALNRNRRG